MDEQEKRELIQAINEIRKELNLEPYPLEYLEVKGLEELRKLYSIYFKMREDYRKRLKEEKRFKLSYKAYMLIGIPIVVFSVLLTQFLWKISPQLEEKEEVIQKIGTEKQIDFTIQYSFKGPDGNYVIVVQNNGTENVTFSKILVDDEEIIYNVFSGYYPPLEPGGVVYLQLLRHCDNLPHILKIISENKTIEAKLPEC